MATRRERIKGKIRDNLPSLILIVGILLMCILFFWPRIFITIHAGEAGVLYQRFFGGTVTDKVYSEGFHIVAPWDKMQVYNVRVQTDYRNFQALSRQGLPVKLTLAIRYRPLYQTLGLLHKNVGPEYLEKVVIPQTEDVIRQTVGQYTAEQLYSQKRGVVEGILKDSLEKVMRRFVLMESVVIREVILPDYIIAAIERKLEQEQLAIAYDFKIIREEKEARRKEIEAGGIKAYNDIVSSSLNDKVLTWKGVEATLGLATSNNAKVVVIGSGKEGLPVILNTGDASSVAK
ncbi:MAG: prohibitin family protein [Desulfuromonadales bacterium]|nr:prohibitin family protein [Desulfuromonadales bacterium]